MSRESIALVKIVYKINVFYNPCRLFQIKK